MKTPAHEWPETAEAGLINADLAPVPLRDRTWNLWHMAALWTAMSVCIPTYMLSASMVSAGLNWWQSLLAILAGNAIVLLPLILNGHAGTRYGIPFPVFARAAYGIRGAHLPSALRSLVACGWFGIQTWIGGIALSAAAGLLWPPWEQLGGSWQLMGQRLPDFLGFFVFWLLNLFFVVRGTESIRRLESLAAPFLIAVGLLLLAWAVSRVGGFALILQSSEDLSSPLGRLSRWSFFWGHFMPWLTAMVGFWATLSLNIPDFSRYARSQKDQALGQALGLLTTMPLFAFIGVVVTSATVILYGEAIWNPVDLMKRLVVEYDSPLLGILAMLTLVVATLSTNIAANVVAPANSISNLAPRWIGFRTGGVMAAVAGVLILPWRLLEVYQGWLISYSGLLGAVAGVLICDYFVIRRRILALPDLYSSDGIYRYDGGVNRTAVGATAAGVGVALAGMLHPSLTFLFNGAWFSATITAFLLYWSLMRDSRLGWRDDEI